MKPEAAIFFDAIQRNQVAQFLVGDPPYFIDGKNDNEEPQNVNHAFNLVVFAAWSESKNPRVPDSFVVGLLDLLSVYPDSNKAIYVACDWIWFYSYCLSDKRRNPGSAYMDLFDIQLEEVALVLRQRLESGKESLAMDRRWAGAEWNSQDGLWTPLVRQAVAVRDQLGGVDFVPRSS